MWLVSEPSGEHGSRALAVWRRLGVIREGLGGRPEGERREQVRAGLERELAGVAEGEREGLMRELVAIEMSMPSRWDEASAVAARLVELAGALPAEERARVARALWRGAGLPASAEAELRQKLKIPADRAVDAERLMEALPGLVQVLVALDSTVWQQWREIAPRTTGRGGGLASSLSRLACGEGGAASAVQDAQRVQRMVMIVLATVRRATAGFARKHLMRFGVDSITEAAKPRKSILEPLEAACWRQYVDLMSQYDAEAIEAELRGAMAAEAAALEELRDRGGAPASAPRS